MKTTRRMYEFGISLFKMYILRRVEKNWRNERIPSRKTQCVQPEWLMHAAIAAAAAAG